MPDVALVLGLLLPGFIIAVPCVICVACWWAEHAHNADSSARKLVFFLLPKALIAGFFLLALALPAIVIGSSTSEESESGRALAVGGGVLLGVPCIAYLILHIVFGTLKSRVGALANESQCCVLASPRRTWSPSTLLGDVQVMPSAEF